MAYDHDKQLALFGQRRRRRRSSPTSGCDWGQQLLAVVAADAAISFVMLWGSGLVRLLVRNVLGWGERPAGVALGGALNVVVMMACAWVGRDVNGGNLNPVSVLCSSFSSDGHAGILFAVLGRIPAQAPPAVTMALGGRQLAVVACDAALSFMWVWAGALAKLLVYHVLGWGGRPEGEALKVALSVGYMFFFAWLGHATRGGAYNPLTVLSAAFSGGLYGFLFTALARIPAQVIGALIGVKLIKAAFSAIGAGPQLSVGIHHGALTEGLLTFMIVMISLTLKKKDPEGFFMKTWISSLSKMTLHILGSDLTGGIMNPASAFGWAYARGDHITTEHLLVYWLAPVLATLIGVWTFNLFTEPNKAKSD